MDKRTEKLIARLYALGSHTTVHLAERFKTNRRQIIRIAHKHGVARTQAQANKVAAPHKKYHKGKRKIVPRKVSNRLAPVIGA